MLRGSLEGKRKGVPLTSPLLGPQVFAGRGYEALQSLKLRVCGVRGTNSDWFGNKPGCFPILGEIVWPIFKAIC